MAVQLSKEVKAKPDRVAFLSGDKIFNAYATAQIVNTMSDGEQFILARGFSTDAIIAGIILPKDIAAITSGSDYDIGIFEVTGEKTLTEIFKANGTTSCKDLYVNGLDFSSGVEAQDINAAILDSIRNICEIPQGESNKEYALVMTANTIGTTTRDILVKTEFIPSN